MILKDHPEVAQLLVPTKPYSLILAVVLVTLNMSLAYLVKVAQFLILGFFLDSFIVDCLYFGWNHQPHVARADS